MNVQKVFIRPLLIAAVVFALNGSDPFPAQRGLQETSIDVCGVPLTVELAMSARQWAVGLGHRTRPEKGRGMLFVFDRIRPLAFTSSNTYFPISVAFINSDSVIQEVLYLANKRRGPERVLPVYQYRLALEVPYGWFKKNGITIGCPVSGIETL